MIHPLKTTFTLAALMLTGLAPGAFAAFPTVGNPNDTSPTNGATLAAAIQAAYNSGAAGVTINPGTYTLNQPNTGDTFQDPNLKLDGISHSFEIDAYNVKFVMLGNHTGIDLDFDTGLVIKGLTIGYASPYGNQGVIWIPATTAMEKATSMSRTTPGILPLRPTTPTARCWSAAPMFPVPPAPTSSTSPETPRTWATTASASTSQTSATGQRPPSSPETTWSPARAVRR